MWPSESRSSGSASNGVTVSMRELGEEATTLPTMINKPFAEFHVSLLYGNMEESLQRVPIGWAAGHRIRGAFEYFGTSCVGAVVPDGLLNGCRIALSGYLKQGRASSLRFIQGLTHASFSFSLSSFRICLAFRSPLSFERGLDFSSLLCGLLACRQAITKQ